MKIKILSTLIVLLISITAYSQYRIQKVSTSLNSSLDGIVYALPQTVIRLDISLLKTERIPGPLSDYTFEYLGVNNYIKNESSNYSLVDITFSSFSEIDPDQIYYLQFPTQKAKDEPESSFRLSDIGTLVSYNASGSFSPEQTSASIINQNYQVYDEKPSFDYNAAYNRKKVVDTIIRKINIDTISIDRFIFRTSWANLNEKDKANQAALKIQNIREQRFNLLTGFQEVNYGESIIYMDAQLKKMEEAYLQLFLGKETSSIENYTVFIIPGKNEKARTVLEIENGKSVEIEFKQHGTTALLPEKPLQKENHLYYRVPEKATVNLKFDGKLYKSVDLTINQFGKLLTAPLNNTRLYFDPNSGNLIKMVRR
jgi:hypothetical protein